MVEGDIPGSERELPGDPAWSETLACADAPCTGAGRSHDRPIGSRRRSASGRRGAVADDARSREVRLDLLCQSDGLISSRTYFCGQLILILDGCEPLRTATNYYAQLDRSTLTTCQS